MKCALKQKILFINFLIILCILQKNDAQNHVKVDLFLPTYFYEDKNIGGCKIIYERTLNPHSSINLGFDYTIYFVDKFGLNESRTLYGYAITPEYRYSFLNAKKGNLSGNFFAGLYLKYIFMTKIEKYNDETIKSNGFQTGIGPDIGYKLMYKNIEFETLFGIPVWNKKNIDLTPLIEIPTPSIFNSINCWRFEICIGYFFSDFHKKQQCIK